MKLNIIHLEQRKDRESLLAIQLREQNINKYNVWEGILDNYLPQRGIAKAHKQIVFWAKNHNLPSVMIAEDDIKFTSLGAFNYFIKNEPKEYDIYLGGITYGNINEKNLTNDFSGLTLYIVQQKFYDIFLSLPENENIDRALANKGKFLVCNPFVVVQHNGFSDNKKKHQNYDIYFQDRNLF